LRLITVWVGRAHEFIIEATRWQQAGPAENVGGIKANRSQFHFTRETKTKICF
jgi:hypothetical protein